MLYDMKKLLILLFSILISNNSFAGSADGKGLECIHKSPDDFPSQFIWFDKDSYIIPFIRGYKLDWTPAHPYIEEGAKYIKFIEVTDGMYDLIWWGSKTLNRDTLLLTSGVSSQTWQCNIFNSKQQLTESLFDEIRAAKKTNKI